MEKRTKNGNLHDIFPIDEGKVLLRNPEYEKVTLVTRGGGGEESKSRFTADVTCESRTQKPIISQKIDPVPEIDSVAKIANFNLKINSYLKIRLCTQNSIHKTKIDSVPKK